jgi:hypothetical protein
MSLVGPYGFGGQPSWATAASDKPSCATAASQTAVAHGGMARPAVVAYGGKFPLLYISQKLARKCHKNLGKRKRWLGRRGEESEWAE